MSFSRLVAGAAISLAAGILPAFAADSAYIDDRSDAARTIQSFYNAINRQEFARAWGYFGDEKPSKDFEAFAKGFEGTQEVRLVTGDVSSEGAAGSIIYSLPVAIVAYGKDNSEAAFAGCYTLRMANAQIQEPPFRPLSIVRGSLKKAEEQFEPPAACEGALPPEAADETLKEIKAAYAAAREGSECIMPTPGQDPQTLEVEQYRIPYRYEYDEASAPEREARLFRFYCNTGAYNEQHIYYLANDDGFRELQFASPELDIRYVDDDSEGKLESMRVIGFETDVMLINSFYDEATKSITSYSKWRGVGDASSTGTYIFRNGTFTLTKYEVDPTYDGEMNPETVVDYDMAP